MAPSLQELIAFLLNEVALCGNQGATLQDVLKSIEVFYLNSPQNDSGRRQLVDRHFKTKVWSWLTRNPEVSVGIDNEWNHLSLDEFEKLEQSACNPQEEATEENEEIENDREGSESSAALKFRVFVSKERTWYAVAGHEPDETKLPASEFMLLSIIANRKSNGIPQTELIQISGQDKRSVPKRTDALVAKGYIEKRAIQFRAARTSLCTLRRFLNAPTAQPSGEKETEAKPLIEFDDFVKRLFEALRENDGTISRNDLKKELGFEDLWRSRILSRTVRKYEKIGVLKRVRVKSQYNMMHPCIMLLREPTKSDIAKFFEFTQHGFTGDEEDPADADEELDVEADSSKQNIADQEDGVVDSGRTIPAWTPDRVLCNQLFDIIDKAGTSGITNEVINRSCFGHFYKRPSENMVHRLTDCWQISQPPHLRHLAIVRDSDVHKTTIHYVHYSARNFAKKVAEGTAFWEAVEFTGKKGKSSKTVLPPVHAPAQLDEYGLPQNNIPVGMMKNGNVTLLQGLASCKPADYSLTRKDPMGVTQADGSYRVQAGNTITLEGFNQSGIFLNNRKGRPRTSTVRPTPKRIKRESSIVPESENVDTVMEEDPPVPLHWKKTRTPKKQKKFKGMSKKERFEAMGWDESWTEYSALVMEKPTPGVYITSHGKRRPAGKKQGRPKASRIAVFKSSKLSSLSWFTKDENDSDHGEEGEGEEMTPAVAATPSLVTEEPISRQPSEAVESTPTQSRSSKRGLLAADVLEPPNPSKRAATPNGAKERPKKQARIRGPQKGSRADQVSKSPEPNNNGEAAIDLTPVDVNVTGPSQSGKSQDQIPSNHIESADQRNAGDNTMGPPSRLVTPKPQASTVYLIPSTPMEVKRNEIPKEHGSSNRGGSIPFLRRKIIMDIVEKAGGAYPGGGELWYPFTTAWMRMNHKEKPDMRTLKRAVKYLVDAGTLQQMTFSGKDCKGAMVTKTILRKPDMLPDDPLIKDLQVQLLARDRDPKNSFSPHIETNHNISRNSGALVPAAVSGQKPRPFTLPTVSNATVHLRSKPASVLIQEKKRGLTIQRKLMKRMLLDDESETDSEDDLDFYEDNVDIRFGVQRLAQLEPGSGDQGTSIYRPWIGNGMAPKMSRFKVKKSIGRRKQSRPLRRRNLNGIEAMRMLMNPGQIFHSSTNTFATGSIKRRWGARKYKTWAETRPSKVYKFIDAAQELVSLAQSDDPVTEGNMTEAEKFMSRIDKIMIWELENDGMIDSKLDDHLFIVHEVGNDFSAGGLQTPVRFYIDKPLRNTGSRKARMLTRALLGRQRHRKSKLETARANKTKKLEGRQPPRRRTTFKPLPEGVVRRYMVAITAVRTLAGGFEGKVVDWDLVPLAFPNSDPDTVKRHGKSIIARNRMEIHKMQRDFQERYLQAYEKEQVPPIDYENLSEYNWPAVVEWASIELDFSTSEKAPTLPATREQFDSMFDLREEPFTVPEEVHITSGALTVANKKRLLARVPFVVEQPRTEVSTTPKYNLEQLEIAKTWVRGNVATPEEQYNTLAANETLAPIGESLLAAATQSLMTDRIICNAHRGRIGPGRNYMLHDVFLQAMERRRAIDIDQLARAAEFKTTVLDPALKNEGAFKINYHAGDGDALAVDELFAHNHIELVPLNLPREKFGLIDGAYLTRQMDKSRLRFEMEVRPLPGYIYGNPIRDIVSSIPPPRPPASRHLPLWFDIHGRFLPDWWGKSIASVVGCLILRPGVSAESIILMVKPGLMKWEVELLLEEWLLKVGIVEKSETPGQSCWSLKEWWWMALGDIAQTLPVVEAIAT